MPAFILRRLLPCALMLLMSGTSAMARAPTLSKAQKLVRQRLNPRANLDVMTPEQLRKYAYAMQIEMQRLIREEQVSVKMRDEMRTLLNGVDDAQQGTSAELDMASLISAMKVEGLVRYGLPYATPSSSWDKLRSAHGEFASFTDAELYDSFQKSGKGISSTFGDLY